MASLPEQLLLDTRTKVYFDSALTGRYVVYDPTIPYTSNPIKEAFLRFVQPTVRVEGVINRTFAPYGEAKTSHVVGAALLTGGILALAGYGAWALYRELR